MDHLVIGRPALRAHAKGASRFGTSSEGHLHLKVRFRARVVCGEIGLTAHRNASGLLPPLAS
ncbi:MAG: hypothetical protein K2W96_10360 [Gemmataceae bacterium]|nr:hypothetical protein [Gemmataceae bacterium]